MTCKGSARKLIENSPMDASSQSDDDFSDLMLMDEKNRKELEAELAEDSDQSELSNSEDDSIKSDNEVDDLLSIEKEFSSSLDIEFYPQLQTYIEHLGKEKSPKSSKYKRKRYTLQELENLVVKENPKDHYTNFHEIGRGSYGKVYIARDKNTKEKIALKQMKREFGSNDSSVDSTANEIALLQSCHHPNIVNYINAFLWKNQIWVVMEYCDAGTLKQLLEIELNEQHISVVVKQVLFGMNYLHQMHRIHRDIKSANILLNANGDVKVADLGLMVEGDHVSGMAGSKYWTAPEMIKRHPYDTKVDIWSIGALCMEMAEGKPPYSNYKPLKALFYVATKGAPSLKKQDKWSDTFKDFLSQCFIMDPAKRPSAEELLKHPFVESVTSRSELRKALKLVFLIRITTGI